MYGINGGVLRICALSFLFAAFLCAAYGGRVQENVSTTLCEVMKNPQMYDQKNIKIHAQVVLNVDYWVVFDNTCQDKLVAFEIPSDNYANPSVQKFLRNIFLNHGHGEATLIGVFQKKSGRRKLLWEFELNSVDP